MTDAWVLPGKIGDILSALPILGEEARIHGKRQVLVVSREYASILDRAPYVDPVVYEGDWQDLSGALRFAKKNFKKVINLATYGKQFPVEHLTPSYEYDRWYRAGYLDKWDTLPLEMDVEDAGRVSWLTKKVILIADRGQGSPFQYSNELSDLIAASFPDHHIALLSAIKLPSFCEFIPLYNHKQAAALVTIDTAHLHLSKACNIPTFVLATDKPSPWSGSGWSKKFKWYARYSEWNERKDELVRVMKRVLEGRKEPEPAVIAVPQFGYNPTIYRNGHDTDLMAFRYHQNPKQWRSRLAIKSGEIAKDIEMPESIAAHTAEDAKLFSFRGQTHISYVNAMFPGGGDCGFTPCSVGYGPLVQEGDKWKVEKHYRINYGGNDFTSQCKNLVFFENSNRLYCIFRVSPEHEVLEVEEDRVAKVLKTPAPEWRWGQMKGGSNPIPFKGQLLRFFHSRTGLQGKSRGFRYYIGALLMEAQPPFRITTVSAEPILAGEEEYITGHKYWKPNVVFAGTAVEEPGGYRLSYGYNDSQCRTVLLTPEDLRLTSSG